MIDLHGFVIFVESLGTFVQTISSYKLLSEQINQKYMCLKHKILCIGELVKALNLYSNPGVAQHSNANNNSNARVTSKRFWRQKARSN